MSFCFIRDVKLVRAVVSGASGYIGKKLCAYLATNNITVYAISRNKNLKFYDKNIDVIYGELSNYENLLRYLPEEVDVFFHLAWIGAVTSERNDMFKQLPNIELSISAFKLSKALKCKKLIFPGSPLEYQDGNEIIDENAVPAPHNSYGAVKVSCRYILKDLCETEGIDFIYVMLSSVYGPERYQGIISYTIDTLLQKKIPHFTKLEQYWDYVYIDDVVYGLYLIMQHGKVNRFYCLGAGDNIKLVKYIKIISDLIDPSIPLGIGDIEYKNDIVPNAKVDLTNIFKDTGYRPLVRFEDGIRKIINSRKKSLNVLYQSSDLYAPVALVSLQSLLDSCMDIQKLHIFLINSDISEENLIAFEKLVKSYNRCLTVISAKKIDDLLEKCGIEKWNGSYATFYKLFVLNDLNVDTILYIDSDTIVENSLIDLCDFDFEGNILGMVVSAMTKTIKDFYDVNNWYNAGVIYFNVKLWKYENIIEQVKSCIMSMERNKLSMVGDESIINVILSNRIKKMSLEYNFESSWWLWGWNRSLYERLGFEDNNIADYYSVKEILACKQHICINHYTALTTGRPWDRYNDNRAKKKFKYYYEKLGFTEEVDFYKDKPNKKSNIELFFMRLKRKLMPMTYRSIYGFNLHDNAWKEAIKNIKEP